MSIAATEVLVPLLTPHGHIRLVPDSDAPPLPVALARCLRDAFARGSGHGLLHLGGAEVGSILPPSWAWWRDFAARYLTALCATSEGSAVAAPDDRALDALIADAPPMTGAEYLSTDVLIALWGELDAALRDELAAAKVTLQAFLKSLHPVWNLVGRVHFNLAENRGDPNAPFAFMATYASQLSAQARVQHLPLGQALREYGGTANRPKLLSLLLPVQRAAETCAWLQPMISSGELFHPLRWSPQDAARLLASAAELERAGVVLRMPAGWQAGRPARPQVTATVGVRAPSKLGLNGLLDFSVAMTLDGETLSETEVRLLLAGTDTLVLLRGRWVEVDRQRLERTLTQSGARCRGPRRRRRSCRVPPAPAPPAPAPSPPGRKGAPRAAVASRPAG
jgi:SNF2 Helicase protein